MSCLEESDWSLYHAYITETNSSSDVKNKLKQFWLLNEDADWTKCCDENLPTFKMFEHACDDIKGYILQVNEEEDYSEFGELFKDVIFDEDYILGMLEEDSIWEFRQLKSLINKNNGYQSTIIHRNDCIAYEPVPVDPTKKYLIGKIRIVCSYK